MLTLNFARIDPIKGIERMFSWHSIAELVKAILKALLIGGVIYWVVRAPARPALRADVAAARHGAGFVRPHARVRLPRRWSAGLAVIAAIDVPFQLWRYYQGLRMTRKSCGRK